MYWHWLGVLVCLMQSAMFSGLTIGLFGLSRMRLEVEAGARSKAAIKILRLRDDSSFLLSTLLWGNVGVNVLLTILSESVMTGVGAFLFSTFVITIGGEILPQAYLSRNALKIGVYFIPFVKFYQVLLYPVAKPTAMLLDAWLGRESIDYFEEHELAVLIRKHIQSRDSDVDAVEGTGALNFLALDDIPMSEEGTELHEDSILKVPVNFNLPVFPEFKSITKDQFLQKINASGKKWVILVNEENDEPVVALDADGFLRDALLDKETHTIPYHFCHRPIVVKNPNTPLGEVITKLNVAPEHGEDDVIDNDIILLWSEEKKIITGSDILGRLLRKIVDNPREK